MLVDSIKINIKKKDAAKIIFAKTPLISKIVQFNNKKASVESVIMRNIVLLIPPVCWVEVYDVIKGKTKRHADIWFKTKVVTKAEYISENMYN